MFIAPRRTANASNAIFISVVTALRVMPVHTKYAKKPKIKAPTAMENTPNPFLVFRENSKTFSLSSSSLFS